MQPSISRHAVAIATIALSFSLTSRAALAGCEKDTDCKGDRVCEEGRCVSPAGPPPLPSAPAVQHYDPEAGQPAPPPVQHYDPAEGQPAPPPPMQTFTDTPQPGKRKGKGLLITGIVFLGMAVIHGAVAGGLAAGGSDTRVPKIINAGLAGACGITGGVMVSVGAIRMRRSAAADGPPLAGSQVSAGPGLVLGVRGSF